MTNGLDELENALGHAFADRALLERALTHSSLSSTGANGAAASNERLEFLGDRVLALILAEVLFARFPDEREGALAYRFAALARQDALAHVAGAIGLARYVRLSAGEAESGGRENESLLADACEAVIAALYLDGGLPAARRFIERYWSEILERDPTPPKDAKTALQEWTQSRELGLPSYVELERAGPSHAPIFTVEVRVSGEKPVKGTGPSKRKAEQEAAAAMLARLSVEARRTANAGTRAP